MLKEKKYLVLGIGTDIGKTFFVENFCLKNSKAKAIKPVISGFQDDDLNSDAAKILRAMNLEINQKNLDEISPWRFEEPISPHLAGIVDYKKLLQFCQKKITEKKADEILLIEGAGGVMSPITNEKTFLDLARDLKIPVLLVAANYLGAISHTLTAIEVLKKNEVLIEKIIFNEIFPSKKNSQDIAKAIYDFSQVETVAMSNLNSIN